MQSVGFGGWVWFRVKDSVCRVQCVGSRFYPSRVYGVGFRVEGSGFSAWNV